MEPWAWRVLDNNGTWREGRVAFLPLLFLKKHCVHMWLPYVKAPPRPHHGVRLRSVGRRAVSPCRPGAPG